MRGQLSRRTAGRRLGWEFRTPVWATIVSDTIGPASLEEQA
jgi:hypothetical protein